MTWPRLTKTTPTRILTFGQFRTVLGPGLKSCWCGALARHWEVQRCPFDQQSNKKTNKNNSNNSDSAGARHCGGTAKAIATSEAESLGAKKKRCRLAQNLLMTPNIFCMVLDLPRSWRNVEWQWSYQLLFLSRFPSDAGGHSPPQWREFDEHSHRIHTLADTLCLAAGKLLSLYTLQATLAPVRSTKAHYLYRASKAASSTHKTPGCLHGFYKVWPHDMDRFLRKSLKQFLNGSSWHSVTWD